MNDKELLLEVARKLAQAQVHLLGQIDELNHGGNLTGTPLAVAMVRGLLQDVEPLLRLVCPEGGR